MERDWKKTRRVAGWVVVLCVLVGPVSQAQTGAVPAGSDRPNRLTAAEEEQGWKLLFDGATAQGWRGFQQDTFPSEVWSVEEGTLRRKKGGSRPRANLITTSSFEDFELSWEWRFPAGGNSGVKYFVSEDRSGPIGHEYQMLDRGATASAQTDPRKGTASLYDLLSPQGVSMRPPGDFNQSRILVQGRRVEHWLNGVKVLEYELESGLLKEVIANSKFKDVPGFGDKFATPILLQDHGDEVEFRNLKIRELDVERSPDWSEVQRIRRKQRSGDTLTRHESAYLSQADEWRRRRNEEFLSKNPPRPSTGLVPLTELVDRRYKGHEGGLYPGARNEPPSSHLQAGVERARQVVPRDSRGNPAPDGKIVLVSIGMSNTSQEFQIFQEMAAAEADRHPALVVVDGAQGGQAADATADPEAEYWRVLEERLGAAGVTVQQVQAAWLKQAIRMPTRSFPAEARTLQQYLVSTLNNLNERFPNLKLVYLSSRIYGGFAETILNPEPHAYESAFAVKWVIQEQLEGKPQLNYDPGKGPVRSPWLAWGPYLWADGLEGRADGLVYTREDLAADGTHPSTSGRTKVAEQLLAFLKRDLTARQWFLEPDKPAPDRADVRYGPHPRQVLDFWQAQTEAPSPLVIYIHGGGFRAGDKTSLRPSLLEACLEAGFSVAAVNYRLSDEASFPAFMLDGARAVQFLRSKAEEWNIDPRLVASTGGSAGGGISLWLGFHDDLADPASSDPIARHSTRLTCVGAWNTQSSYDPRFYREVGLAPAAEHPVFPPFYGLSYEEFDTPQAHRLFDEAAPINYVSPDDPPIFLFYPQVNLPLPPDATPNRAVHHPRLGELLKERLEALGIEVVLHTGVADRMAEMEREMVQFFKKHFAAAAER